MLVFPFGLLIFVLVLGVAGWTYGRQISTIDIRLLDKAVESSDRYLGKLVGGELPDYQVVLDAAGSKIKSNVQPLLSR